MGFPTSDCISPDEMVNEFACTMCFQLPDVNEAIVTSCYHVFCKNCLRDWLKSSSPANTDDLSEIQSCPCPNCKTTVRISDIRSLKDGAPLAFRIFGRIKVKCPLHVNNCQWVGDYSEVQSHLTNSSDHIGQDTNGDTAIRNANALKEQANEKFTAHNYQDAIRLYSKAISICPKEVPECFANRALAYFHIRDYENCLKDCKAAIELRPQYAKAYVRGSRALFEMGKIDDAQALLLVGKENYGVDKNSDIMKELRHVEKLIKSIEEGKMLSAAGKHADARKIFSQLLQKTSARQVMVLAANEECYAGNTDRALRLTLNVLRINAHDVDALLVRAKAMYINGDFDNALKMVKQVLKLSPDDRNAQQLFKGVKNLKNVIHEANKSNSKLGYCDAVIAYSLLLGENPKRFFIDGEWTSEMTEIRTKLSEMNIPTIATNAPLAIQIHAERANALFRLKKYDMSLKDCGHAIYYQDDCKRAWLTKAYTLMELGKPEDAVRELSPVMERWGQSDTVVKGVYEKAQFEVRKARRPKYYEIVGVSTLASEPEIKAAYKQKALIYHPDRLSPDASSDDRKQSEEKFKLLGEALEYLTDSFKRKLYDEGYDKEAILERIARAERAAHHH